MRKLLQTGHADCCRHRKNYKLHQLQFETTRFLSVALEQMQASDGAAREALEATGLLSAEEITLIIGRRKRAAAN